MDNSPQSDQAQVIFDGDFTYPLNSYTQYPECYYSIEFTSYITGPGDPVYSSYDITDLTLDTTSWSDWMVLELGVESYDSEPVAMSDWQYPDY